MKRTSPVLLVALSLCFLMVVQAEAEEQHRYVPKDGFVPNKETRFNVRHEKMSKAPAGFSWKAMKAAPMDFLVPDGWHFYSLGTKGTFISKEDIQKEGSFKTGFSFYLFGHNKGKFPSPTIQMKSSVDSLKKDADIIVLDSGVLSQRKFDWSDLYWVRFEKRMSFGPITCQTGITTPIRL